MSRNLLKELTAKLKMVKISDSDRIKDETHFINMLVREYIYPKEPERFYITEQQVATMFGLYRFIQEKTNLNKEEFDNLYRKKFSNDVMVRTLYSLLPHLIDDLCYLGPGRVIIKYIQLKVWQCKLKEGKASFSLDLPRF